MVAAAMIRPIRSPRSARERRPVAPTSGGGRGDERALLRLAVTRGGLGLELDGPIPLGPLSVLEMTIALVGLSFPVDLSGGVPRFRHRRGRLERLVVAGQNERLSSQLAPRLRGVLGPLTPSLVFAPTPGGMRVGLHDGASALAFDALWAPRDGEARFIVTSARGLGLGRPALSAAFSAVDALVGRLGERRGALVSLGNTAFSVLREVLPSAGARLPDAEGARWGALSTDAAGWRVECDGAIAPPELDPLVIRELELASLTLDADDALAGGDYERARELYIALLERAPRHPALATRIADIDRWASERMEAAISTLVEAMPPEDTGALGGELFAAVLDREGAERAFFRAAETEPYGPLAALLLLEASRLAEHAHERLRRLDEAIARAPASATARWARFDARLALHDFRGAMADLEHLEAAARGPWNRHEIFRRAGDALLSAGHDAQAASIFERALRYAPESPRAVAGLAKSLLALGRTERALELLARAADLAERSGTSASDIVLSLAETLADRAGDLPAAIARVRTITASLPEALEARGLEARWRARLGDLAGASIGYARMREWIETATELDQKSAARWLAEAARFERDSHDDPRAAEAYLDFALRLAPHDPEVERAVRGAISNANAPSPEPLVEGPPSPLALEGSLPLALPRPSAVPTFDLDMQLDDEAEGATSLADEQRAEALADRLRADPTNHEVAVELADLLLQLRRDLDLFALLSARLEDVTGAEREDLLPRQRAVLERLVESARSEGREDEASLYEFALDRLEACR